jgi:hypothetical protein
MRLNRNPALYRPTKAELSKSMSMLTQHDDILTRSDVNTVKLRALDDYGVEHAALQLRRDLNDGVVKREPLNPKLEAVSIPNFDTFFREPTAAGGHQPTYGQRHKPRIFNPLANDWIRKGQPSGASTGLSVAQLRSLLDSSVPRHKRPDSAEGSIGLDLASELHYDTVCSDFSKTAWDSSFCTEASIRASQNPLPHPGTSILDREVAHDIPFRQKLAASRAKAAGTLIWPSEVCFERKRLDADDASLAASGLHRTQSAMKQELSPRREYQRGVIRGLIRERKQREDLLADRVARLRMEEAFDRIPRPKPLTLGTGRDNFWNGSVLLSAAD